VSGNGSGWFWFAHRSWSTHHAVSPSAAVGLSERERERAPLCSRWFPQPPRRWRTGTADGRSRDDDGRLRDGCARRPFPLRAGVLGLCADGREVVRGRHCQRAESRGGGRARREGGSIHTPDLSREGARPTTKPTIKHQHPTTRTTATSTTSKNNNHDATTQPPVG